MGVETDTPRAMPTVSVSIVDACVAGCGAEALRLVFMLLYRAMGIGVVETEVDAESELSVGGPELLLELMESATLLLRRCWVSAVDSPLLPSSRPWRVGVPRMLSNVGEAVSSLLS